MVGVATSSIEAATTEDYIGSTDNLQHQVDPDVQVYRNELIYIIYMYSTQVSMVILHVRQCVIHK